jgi:predicted ferric reductase
VVQSAQHVAADMVEISLAPLGGPVAVTAGQFVLVAFFAGSGFRGCGEFHPFTVSSVENGGHIRIAVKALGDCTQHIQSLEPGVTARVHGGFGEFLAHRPAMPQLWIAGGIGITPFLAVLREGLVSQPTKLLYLYRAETSAAFVQELQDRAGADPRLSLQAMQVDNAHADFEALLPDASELSRHECYLCGPPGMIAALKPALLHRGITPRHIHFENFGFR